jgi:hypothetical protein
MLENGHNQAQTRLEMHMGGWISTLWLDHYVGARVLEDQTKVKFKVIKVRLRSSLDSGASMQSFFGELSPNIWGSFTEPIKKNQIFEFRRFHHCELRL